MGLIVLPRVLAGHTPAVAVEVMANLNAIVARVNGNLEADNLKANAVTTSKILDGAVTNAKLAGDIAASKLIGDIALAQLDAIGAAQVPVADGAGVLTARTIGGAGAIDAAGALSLVAAQTDAGADVNLPAGGALQQVCSIVCPAGTYLAWGKCFIDSTSNIDVCEAHLTLDGGDLDIAFASPATSGLAPLVVGPESHGGGTLRLMAGTSFGGQAKYGRLAVLRIA